jgi:hypothetical protein
MLNRYRQTGAFILVTVVFLMAAGGAMLYAMSNFSTASSATASLVHNGNMALAAAQSGLKYCVAQLGTGACSNPAISGISCDITVNDGGCNGAVAPLVCTITSAAYCPSQTDATRGAKKLSIQVQKTSGGYQMIPASRQVLPLP